MKRTIWALGACLLISLIANIVLIVPKLNPPQIKTRESANLIDSGNYQAVFLANGQVYFGKLSEPTSDVYKLAEVYYYDSTASTTLKSLVTAQQSPTDQMIIQAAQVLFWENLDKSGKLSQDLRKAALQ